MKKQKRGIISGISWLLWTIFCIGLLFAIIKLNNIRTVGDVWRYARAKSNEIMACFQEYEVQGKLVKCSLNLKVATDIQPTDSSTANQNEPKQTEEGIQEQSPETSLKVLSATSNSKEKAIEQLNQLNVVKRYEKAKYSRTEWKHWSSVGSSCWNSREEALASQGKNIVYLTKEKQPTEDKANACSIASGYWEDSLSNEVFTSPSELDVDHIVPLKLAASSGGQAWDKKKKEQYANDKDVLVVTSANNNRSKGAKTPTEWMPPNQDSHCDYAKIYVNVLAKYELNITQSDKDVLQNALSSCAY